MNENKLIDAMKMIELFYYQMRVEGSQFRMPASAKIALQFGLTEANEVVESSLQEYARANPRDESENDEAADFLTMMIVTGLLSNRDSFVFGTRKSATAKSVYRIIELTARRLDNFNQSRVGGHAGELCLMMNKLYPEALDKVPYRLAKRVEKFGVWSKEETKTHWAERWDQLLNGHYTKYVQSLKEE